MAHRALKHARLVAILFAFVWIGVENPHARLAIGRRVALPINLADGDLVFREGIGVEAELVRGFQSSERLSHVGLAFRTEHGWVIIHAAPSRNGTGHVRAEPLASFLASDQAEGYAVFRPTYPAVSAVGRLRKAAVGAARAHMAFDPDFDLEDDKAVYCTEFAWRMFRKAGLSARKVTTPVELPLFHRNVMFPADLLRSVPMRPIL